MGAQIFSAAVNKATDVTLIAWVRSLFQAMLSAGFVQSTDSGQITMETPASSSEAHGYAIFRFDDALQSTHPVFFKIEFPLTINSAATTQAHWLTVGRGSDGNGQITGVLASRRRFGATGATGSSTLIHDHLVSAGEGYAIFQGAINDSRVISSAAAPHTSSGFIIERSRDETGACTGAGLLVVTTPGESGAQSMTGGYGAGELLVAAINYATATHISGPSPVCAPGNINDTTLGNSTALAAGSIGPVFPWELIAPGIAPWRSCVVVSIPAGDMPGGIFQSKLCDSVGTFYPIRPGAAHARWGIAHVGGAATTVSRWFGAGIRWED